MKIKSYKKRIVGDVPKEYPEQIFNELLAFQGYGFNECLDIHSLVELKEVSAFKYICGMAAAGFEIAEKQGRTVQSNPQTRTQFAKWKAEVDNHLNKVNTSQSSNSQTQTNINETIATFE